MGQGQRAAALSRRDMLKRGAIVGVAGMWVAPALDVIGIGRQFAQAASRADKKDKSGEKEKKD